MTRPGFTRQLKHTCTVQVRTAGALDARGNPTYTWADSVTGIPCLYMARAHTMVPGREISDRSQDVLLTDYIIFMAYRSLSESDNRITEIEDAAGDTLEAGPLNIRLVKNAAGQSHHIEVHVSHGGVVDAG